MNNKIDFILMWVDGNDPKWLQEKNTYKISNDADGSIYRYRDWDLLRYWFRGIEKYAPWVNNIYFVTWGHVPEWLNTNNPKIKIIKHDDFIPKKYLPTFSANTIELNLHRIRGLSNNFVLFNDDMFVINKVKPEDFFKNNVPMETVGLNVHCPQKSLISRFFCINDCAVINEHFDFKTSIKNNLSKWLSFKNGSALLRTLALLPCPRFPGFWQHHLPTSLNKKTFIEVWEKEPKILSDTCENKFREKNDVNQWLFREWQIASGNFKIRPISFGKSFYIDRDGIKNIKEKAIRYVSKQKGKIFVINDGEMSEKDFTAIVNETKQSFNKILPEKSSFEK